MADQTISSVATPEQKTAALEMVLRRHGVLSDDFVHDFTEHADDAWVTANGANMVARAWTDPAFRARMLANGTAAAREMGFDLGVSRMWGDQAASGNFWAVSDVGSNRVLKPSPNAPL
jgi:Nitrile hydratase, alpha chain